MMILVVYVEAIIFGSLNLRCAVSLFFPEAVPVAVHHKIAVPYPETLTSKEQNIYYL